MKSLAGGIDRGLDHRPTTVVDDAKDRIERVRADMVATGAQGRGKRPGRVLSLRRRA